MARAVRGTSGMVTTFRASSPAFAREAKVVVSSATG
jgi:hypothetical protein